MRYLNIVFAVAMLSVETSYGQDSHYWTEQFGNRSMLLSGVVIGSTEDLGAVFYNPARMSQFESPAFVISAKVYEYSTLRISDGLGEDLDLNSSRFGGAPSLVAGTFSINKWPRHKFAYAFLSKNRFEGTFSFNIDEFGDFLASLPGEEYFSGEIEQKENKRDEWLGGAWSYSMNDHWSVGLSAFYSRLNYGEDSKIQLQAYNMQVGTGMILVQRAYNFRTDNIMLKAGLGWQSERITAGLTVTAPRLQFQGKGATRYEVFQSGIDFTEEGNTNGIYEINSQTDLNARYKSPLSIGIGTGIRVGESLIHLSAEWFDNIPYYEIMRSEPFTGQSTGNEVQLFIVDEAKSVINYGVGTEIRIGPSLALFASFAADISNVPENIISFGELENEINTSTFRANIYHFGFGTDFKTKFANLTLGATYATASEMVDRTIDIDEGMESTTTTSLVQYGRWRFLIGFEFPFLDKMKSSTSKEN